MPRASRAPVPSRLTEKDPLGRRSGAGAHVANRMIGIVFGTETNIVLDTERTVVNKIYTRGGAYQLVGCLCGSQVGQGIRRLATKLAAMRKELGLDSHVECRCDVAVAIVAQRVPAQFQTRPSLTKHGGDPVLHQLHAAIWALYRDGRALWP